MNDKGLLTQISSACCQQKVMPEVTRCGNLTEYASETSQSVINLLLFMHIYAANLARKAKNLKCSTMQVSFTCRKVDSKVCYLFLQPETTLWC
jgi:hypothetical protein